MTEEVKETKKEAAKKSNPMDKLKPLLSKLKPLLSLEPVLWNKFGAKLKSNIRNIYYCLLVLFAVLLVKSFYNWGAIGFGAFFSDIILYIPLFFVARLFAEVVAKD